MKLDNKTSFALIELAYQYLKENPQRYNEKEKKQFMDELLKNIKGNQNYMFDGVYDFLVYYDLINGVSRHKSFARYITDRYCPASHKTILDVGAGRLCELSCHLARKGFDMFAMDPNIRLLPHEANKFNIHISKDLFFCDEFATNKTGTNIKNFDLLIGLEPCIGTEHIIRQGLKYEKPFEVSLCYQAHDALNGQKFKTPEDWYEYLQQISSEVDIIKTSDDYIAYHK